MKRNEKQGQTSKVDYDWMYKNINPYYKKLVQKEEVEFDEIFGLSGKEKQAKADKTSADDAEARAAQQRRNKASDERIAQEKRDKAAAAARRKKQGYAQGGHAKEEVEIGESKALQIIMALDDAGIESKKVQGTEQVSVAKKDYKFKITK